MKSRCIFLAVVLAALTLALAGDTRVLADGQHSPAGRGPVPGPMTSPAPQPHPQPQPQPPHRMPPPQPLFVTPTAGPTPFPNITTLSGPLPNTVNATPQFPARDLYRMRSPQFNTWTPYPYYGYGGGYGDFAAMPAEPQPPQPPAQVPTGLLRLDVTPGSAQVFVDGFYSGTVDDIGNRRGLTLPEGPHRIELRSTGYQPSTVDVLVPRDVLSYRAALDPVQRPASAAQGSTTFYVIPGCYLGNVPPRPERVGPGCDVKQARVLAAPAQPGTPAPSATPQRAR